MEGQRWGREKNQSTKLEKDKEKGGKQERESRGAFKWRENEKKKGTAIAGSMSETDTRVQLEKI